MRITTVSLSLCQIQTIKKGQTSNGEFSALFNTVNQPLLHQHFILNLSTFPSLKQEHFNISIGCASRFLTTLLLTLQETHDEVIPMCYFEKSTSYCYFQCIFHTLMYLLQQNTPLKEITVEQKTKNIQNNKKHEHAWYTLMAFRMTQAISARKITNNLAAELLFCTIYRIVSLQDNNLICCCSVFKACCQFTQVLISQYHEDFSAQLHIPQNHRADPGRQQNLE